MIQIVFPFIKLILMKFELYFSPSVFKYDKQLGMGNHIFIYKKVQKKVDKKHCKKKLHFCMTDFRLVLVIQKKKSFLQFI